MTFGAAPSELGGFSQIKERKTAETFGLTERAHLLHSDFLNIEITKFAWHVSAHHFN